MPRDIFSVLNKQADLSKITSIGKGAFTFVYMVKKDTARGSIDQIVRVIANVKNHNSMKREKDLLNYFNKFSEFINFNELRKYGANSYFQFFDLVGKQNLKEKIKQNGGFTEQQAKKFLENMLDILEKVHEIGFVHGDIKPANIVCGARRSFLVDWTGSIPSASSFDTETLVGDKKYSPPERLNGILESSGDIYSLGCTLYYALTAKHIFGLEKVKKLEQRLWAQVYYSISELDRLPMFWQKLIFWMTQKDYTKRASIADLRVWLKDGELPSWLDTPPLAPIVFLIMLWVYWQKMAIFTLFLIGL
jgi:serine/threonine protein kinase